MLLNAMVCAYIQKIQAKHREEVQIDTQKIVNKLAKIAFGGIEDVAEVDGKGRVVLRAGADLSRLDGVSYSESISEISSSKSISIKFKDQMKALDMLCKILGIYERRESDNSNIIRANSTRVLDSLKRLRKTNLSDSDEITSKRELIN